jgi:hypothetical protein
LKLPAGAPKRNAQFAGCFHHRERLKLKIEMLRNQIEAERGNSRINFN